MMLPVLGRDKRDRATAYEDAVAQARIPLRTIPHTFRV